MRSPMQSQHAVDFSKADMAQDESRRLLDVLTRGRYALEEKLRSGCPGNEFSQLKQLLVAVEAAEEFVKSVAV